MNRRAFVQRGGAAALLPLLWQQPQRAGSAAPSAASPQGGTSADTLALATVGGLVAGVGPLDNDARVIGIERRLHCTCGCTLDVYTCRTTDFTCTYSPAMHRDVVTQVQAGASAEQVVQAFVTRYGSSVLMAPPVHGFSWASFLVPALAVVAVALGLVAWLMRRRAIVMGTPDVEPAAGPDEAQLERLRRALDEVDS
ncbi:MAG TPA: cytochrome c-type biogenesis protein CcmH [Gemmatimonadales bacterium]|jgi:cytochrome c-type biogenesis protein CcmH